MTKAMENTKPVTFINEYSLFRPKKRKKDFIAAIRYIDAYAQQKPPHNHNTLTVSQLENTENPPGGNIRPDGLHVNGEPACFSGRIPKPYFL